MARSYWSPEDDYQPRGRSRRERESYSPYGGDYESRPRRRDTGGYGPSGLGWPDWRMGETPGWHGRDRRERGYRPDAGDVEGSFSSRDERWQWGERYPGAAEYRGADVVGWPQDEFPESRGPRFRRPSRRYPSEYGAGHRGGRSGGGRPVPPDYRRYLSREEYGIPHEERFERSVDRSPQDGGYRGRGREPRRHNALFGSAGFRRYDGEYDEQWW